LKGLKSLILLETTLISLSSLAHLSLRIPQLEHLRFSLELSILASADKGTQLSGKDEEDRGVLLVLFQELVMLNGNEIRPKEREEAERRFCSRHTTFEEPVLQALYETLAKKHGLQSSAPVVPEKTSLRSKMISESSAPNQLMNSTPYLSTLIRIFHSPSTPLGADYDDET
jgi:hypothetical protein